MSALTFYSMALAFISLVFTSASAVCFAPPLFRSNEEIENMSATICDGNPHLEKALKKDRRNSQIGFFFLSLGFAFQTLSIFIQLVYGY
jgi:hypothetical protein